MSRLQPIRPTTNQLKRVLLEPPGGGFLMYRMNEARAEVVEIFVNLETGEITKADGSPLIFWTDTHMSVGYKLVKVAGQAEMQLPEPGRGQRKAAWVSVVMISPAFPRRSTYPLPPDTAHDYPVRSLLARVRYRPRRTRTRAAASWSSSRVR